MAIACYTVAAVMGLLGLWKLLSGQDLDMTFAFYMTFMALLGEWVLRMKGER